MAGDITDPQTAERIVSQALERFGRIDTLVNNAGRPMRRDTRAALTDREIAFLTSRPCPGTPGTSCERRQYRGLLPGASPAVQGIPKIFRSALSDWPPGTDFPDTEATPTALPRASKSKMMVDCTQAICSQRVLPRSFNISADTPLAASSP